MEFSFEKDQFDRLTCGLDRDKIHAVATASNRTEATQGLLEAVESVENKGIGECFWQEGGGAYRWVLRREGENVRVAVLWSGGVVQGWEHVFWAECPLTPTLQQIRNGLAAVER